MANGNQTAVAELRSCSLSDSAAAARPLYMGVVAEQSQNLVVFTGLTQ